MTLAIDKYSTLFHYLAWSWFGVADMDCGTFIVAEGEVKKITLAPDIRLRLVGMKEGGAWETEITIREDAIIRDGKIGYKENKTFISTLPVYRVRGIRKES